MLDDYREDIPVMEFIGKPNPLPGVLYVITPDAGIPETVDKVPVQFPAYGFNRAA
jgi:hypothetical protein